MKKIILSLASLALLSLVLLFLGTGNRLFPARVSANDPAKEAVGQPIPTARAISYDPKQSFTFPGKVKAAKRAELSFQIPGQIETLNILEGQKVKKGALLASIDRKNHLYAVQAARARYQASAQAFHRASQLYQDKVISKAQFDTALAAHDVARAELAIKEKALADSRLIAPFDGLVSRRYVEKKEHVNKGEPVLLLQDVSGIEVEVQLPEQLVARGGADILDQLNVRFDADPEFAFPASTIELRMESNQETRTYALVIRLPSPADMNILPGMTATVSGIVKQSEEKAMPHPSSVLVPVEAVAFDPDGTPYVWIVEPQRQKARKQQVIIGPMHDNTIEVSHGIHADDLVAIAGLHTLHETTRVRPMKQGKKGLEG
nr:efflux RND transporter periplasmic adaptor subunit [uncultured Desulfobacter sp.]